MANTAIVSDKAPAALGSYSSGIKSGNVIHLSGMLGIDPATGEYAGSDVVSQTHQALTNIRNVLAEVDATMANVADVTVLLADIADFAAMNEVYATYFAEPFPARCCYAVAALPAGARVEIKSVAYL
ncbi:Rid family detoxifying hydrolase [Atopobiaceae bacterium LCP21S3_F11]